MERIYDLYKKLEPIGELIDKNKKSIDIMISEIEDDLSIPDSAWNEVETIRDALTELSLKSGHTAMKSLKNMAVTD